MHLSVYWFLFFTVGTYLTTLAQTPVPAPSAYHIVGRCHDYGTAVGLKASLYALINGKRQKLGEGAEAGQANPKAGTFDLLLSTQATHLVVEMKGYHTLTIPVHFAPGIPADAHFAIYNLVAMTPLDSLQSTTVSSMVDFLSLCYVETDSISPSQDTWLELVSPKSSKRYMTPSLDGATFRTIHFPMLPGTYTAKLSTADGRVISNERFIVGSGVTFKAIRVGKKPVTDLAVAPNAQRTQQTQSAAVNSVAHPQAIASNVPEPGISITAPTTTTLYFDQSSYTLRTQTLPTLDSIAGVLISKPLQATLTGFTDNVGGRTPNVTLSEYRTRTVATYLTRRGVAASQLVTQWHGPDSTAAPDDAEAVKAQSRRVEIRVAPR